MNEKVRSVRRAGARDDINRIIIGLGGQGCRLVDAVRKEIRRAGEEPEAVEFMAIDSDRISLANLEEIPSENQVYMQAPDEKIVETMVPWLPREFRPKAGGGCGMQRISGKAMYLVHRQRVFEAVNAVVRRLRQRTQMTNFMFVIVSACGGGTGSGMLIDFTIDLKRNVSELVGHEPMIFGLGVLPSRSETIQRANGVAALKELHYLLSHKEPVVIGGRDFSNPFELYFLVGREVMGTEKDEELRQSIVRFTIDLGLIPSSSNEYATAGKGAGWVDLQDIRTIIKGASHTFATFGYYRAVFPEGLFRDYFETLDRIEDGKERLPNFSMQSEERWERLNAEKVKLADHERALERSHARAHRLRTGGILGVNKPALRAFQAEIGRLEDGLRRSRREIMDIEASLPHLDEEREDLEREIERLEARREQLRLELTAPIQTENTYVFPLSEEEVDHLADNRHLVEQGDFQSVMNTLGRVNEYHDKTMEVIGKNKILFMPMLNYRMAFHTAALFQPSVLRTLSNFGFVRFDAGGNPIITDDQLWMVMAMLASAPGNVDPQKLSPRAFKDIVENYVAKRAEVKTLPSGLKRHEVAVHSWMIGLQVAPIAPGYPPRLKELEWLSLEYDKLASEREVIQHHAFLFGDPSAFTELTGMQLDRMDVHGTNERVMSFWTSYQPIDESARWLQVPPVLAEALVALDAVNGALRRVARAVESPIKEDFEKMDLRKAVGRLDPIAKEFRSAEESLQVFQRQLIEEEHAIASRLEALTSQVERIRDLPRDPSRLARLQEMAETSVLEVSHTCDLVGDVQAVLGSGFEDLLRTLRKLAASTDAKDRSSAALATRFRRGVSDVEDAAGRFDAGLGNLLVHFQDLEEILTRLFGTLQGRQVREGGDGGGGGRQVLTPLARDGKGPLTQDSDSPRDIELLDRILAQEDEA